VQPGTALLVQWPNLTPSRAWWETRSDEEQAKQRDASLQAISDAFDDARAYWKARDAMGSRGVPRHDGDVKWDAMRKALKGEIPVMITAGALNQIRSVLKFVDDQKLPRVVLVSSADAALVANELKKRNISVICSDILAVPTRRHEPYDQRFTAPARLRDAGLQWCIADGGGSDDAANGRNLPYHAAMAAAFGLSKEEALKGITLYPAQILGVADKIGSIEKGKIADLVVTNGDLLEIATQVEAVYINGKATSMETRQTRLFKKYDNRPRPAQISGTPPRTTPAQGK
jgi:imidazolonepropionase-like amidohydrolase